MAAETRARRRLMESWGLRHISVEVYGYSSLLSFFQGLLLPPTLDIGASRNPTALVARFIARQLVQDSLVYSATETTHLLCIAGARSSDTQKSTYSSIT